MTNSLNKNWLEHLEQYIHGDRCLRESQQWPQQLSVLSVSGDGGKVCATVGLMHSEHSPPVELLADSRQESMRMEPMLEAVASQVFNQSLSIRPGMLFRDLVADYHSELALPHLLVTPQFQWDFEMSEVDLPGITIYPLLLQPLSELECRYLDEFGYAALDQLWERREIDLLDWQRPSAVSELDIERRRIRLQSQTRT